MGRKHVHAIGALILGLTTLAVPARAEGQAAVHVAAVAAAPQADARADLGRGFDMLRAGRQVQAIAFFDRVIATLDQRPAGDARARLCRSEGRENAQDAVIVDPAVCDAHFGRGFALVDLGRGDLAEAALRSATEMAPGNAHYANEYAELFKSRRQWAESYRQFARAWAIVDQAVDGPDARIAARALRGMGFNKMALGDYEGAEELFRRSLTFDPASIAAKAELGHIARRKAIGS